MAPKFKKKPEKQQKYRAKFGIKKFKNKKVAKSIRTAHKFEEKYKEKLIINKKL